MSIKRARTNTVGIAANNSKYAYNDANYTASTWVRNSEWLTLPSVSSSEQKVNGLLAVMPTGTTISLICAGAYTVDWGDGTVENFATGVTSTHTYNFSTVSSTTLTTLGYKQVIVTITPQSGQNLTTVNFNVRPSIYAATNTTETGWLDINASVPNLGSGGTLAFAASTANTTNIKFGMCERINIVTCPQVNISYMLAYMPALRFVNLNLTGTLTSLSNLFFGCYNIEDIDMSKMNTASVTAMNGVFLNCYSLKNAPFINTISATNTSSMLQSCRAIKSSPLYDLRNTTNTSSMYNGCSSLEYVPNLNTPKNTTTASMFAGCYSLETAPMMDTSLVTSVASMFLNCFNLKTVPSYNTVSVVGASNNTTGHAGMFQNCYSLKNAPFLNTSNSTSLYSMFDSCLSLESVPLYNTANCRAFTTMFNGCVSLKEVPLFDMSLATDVNAMFFGCSSLTKVPQFNTTSVSVFYRMFWNCSSLYYLPQLNTTNGTNMSEMFQGATNVREINLTSMANNASSLTTTFQFINVTGSVAKASLPGLKHSLSIANNRFLQPALDSLYTDLATLPSYTISGASGSGTVVTYTTSVPHNLKANQTITITGVSSNVYNLTNAIIASTPTSTTFTVASTVTGNFTNSGTGTVTATLTVTGNPGIATDNPAIATAKGWTVVG